MNSPQNQELARARPERTVMTIMDSIPGYEFHKIFYRISQTISLKGRFTAEAIEEELLKARNTCKRLSEEAETRKQQAFYNQRKVAIDRLVEYGFAHRVIAEAIANPHGRVALTIDRSIFDSSQYRDFPLYYIGVSSVLKRP